MLVLSRRQNQRFKFPELGISIEILEVKGSRVRVGVDAPLEVRILRDELEDHGAPPHQQSVVRLPSSFRHELKNTLNEVGLMLHVYRKRLENAGLEGREQIETDKLLEAALERLKDLSGAGVLSKPSLPTTTEAHQSPQPRQALVVEDNDNERELLAGFLRMCGYEVATAADGVEAIDHLRDNDPPNVILLDVQMPRCDGQAFLEKLRAVEAWSSIQVFVVSGDTPSDKGLSPDDGYTRWFNKPLDPRLIVEEISQVEGAAEACA